MGCFGSRYDPVHQSAFIRVTSTGKPFYWSDETISGTVILQTDEILALRSVALSLVGALVYDVEVGSGEDSRIENKRLVFFTKNCPLTKPSASNNIGVGDGTDLYPGTYQWSFSTSLRENLPPSLMENSSRLAAYIEYYVQVCVPSVGGKSKRQVGKHVVVIIPRVKLPLDVSPVQIDDENRKNLYIHVRLPYNCLVVGQTSIPFELIVRNPNQATIKEAIVELVQTRRLGVAGVRADRIYETSLPDLIDFQDENLHSTFQVPFLVSYEKLVPTTNFLTASDKESPWVISYTLLVTFDIKGIFTNMKFTIPVNIVNDRNKS